MNSIDGMNKQEIFDFVVEKLLKQGTPAVSDGGCWLRTKNPTGKVLKCAVGWLIPDDQYKLDMEDDIYGVVANLTPNVEIRNFLFELQRAHDASSTDLRMMEEFGGVAAKHSLNTEVIFSRLTQ